MLRCFDHRRVVKKVKKKWYALRDDDDSGMFCDECSFFNESFWLFFGSLNFTKLLNNGMKYWELGHFKVTTLLSFSKLLLLIASCIFLLLNSPDGA